MDANLQKTMMQKINRTIDQLKRNQMNGYYVNTIADLKTQVTSLLEEGCSVSVGGSMSLFESGIIDLLRSGHYNYLDRHAEGLTPEDKHAIYRQVFSSDVYISSTNALTENGELYNVDGTGNRVAAITYGPKKVIIIVGINKLVRSIDEAIKRNRQIAAPANAVRLSKQTPCTISGECKDCKSPDRICNNYVTTAFQNDKNRIHVIIVGEALGY